MSDLKTVKAQLAPHGELRVGINLSNFLLVTERDSNGVPIGVSPDVGHALAAELGVPARMVPFKGPGELADAALDDGWDIGNIAAEPERAKTIQFSPAYCEIQATYMVPPGSPIEGIDQVDQIGNRIAVKHRSAYDLWLTDNLEKAELVRVESIDASFERFQQDGLEVLAGLRPALQKQQMQMTGATILDGSFTAIQQSIGCQRGKPEAAAFVHDFVIRMITSGKVAEAIARHAVDGKLSVAPLPG